MLFVVNIPVDLMLKFRLSFVLYNIENLKHNNVGTFLNIKKNMSSVSVTSDVKRATFSLPQSSSGCTKQGGKFKSMF